MTSPKSDATLSHVIDITALHDHDVAFEIEANADERDAIARRLGIPSLPFLRGDFRVHAVRGGAEIRLRLEARAERQCVVSLEPMIETIAEDVVMQFDRDHVDAEDDEESEEWREPLEGDEIDLGELLVQRLSLALDPYPRKPGVEPFLTSAPAAATESPFDALKTLKPSDS